jgi:GTP-binding protein Era
VARTTLGSIMVEVAKAALEDADVILLVVDASVPPNALDQQVAESVQGVRDPQKTILVLNKVDAQRDPDKFKANFEAYRALLPAADLVSTVALDGHNVPLLLEKILERLPLGPRYFPPDQVSDLSVRAIVGEMIREQALHQTHEEVPHAIAVEVTAFKRRSENLIYIQATLYAERDGQKGILIGKGGQMLKNISSRARQEIEAFLHTKVYLELEVRVLENWRKDDRALKRFGYKIS